MPAPTPLYVGNDHDVTLDDLATAIGATAQTSATVAWELYAEEEDGVVPDPATATAVASGSLAHGSGGDYAGVLESSSLTGLTADAVYWLRITAAQSGKNGEWWIRCRAAYRQPGQ